MFSFSGRIGRGYYWAVIAAALLLTIFGLSMQGAADPGDMALSLVVLIPAIWFLFAATVKRTRDIWPDSVGMVWVMLILGIIPLAGLVVTLILGVQPGAKPSDIGARKIKRNEYCEDDSHYDRNKPMPVMSRTAARIVPRSNSDFDPR
jgi:uncharacterized membrane protein YhaH (DUF805 family)